VFGVMSGFGSVERSERSGGLKMRFGEEIGVSGVGNGVVGEGIASVVWARKSPPGS
jgi:hypothetical protein